MTLESPIRILLGPQSREANFARAIARAELPEGPLAVISAGWQEAEGDLGDVGKRLDRPLEDLQIYRRAEGIVGSDPNLATATRDRQDRLLAQQRIYRLRLRQLSIAARHTLKAEGDLEMLAAEQRHAIAQLRALDRHHLHRSEAIWRQFTESYNPDVHAALAHHKKEIAAVIERAAGVLITGGNVAVLLNRMRLFGVGGLLADKSVVAWSAGAMALAERVVLFHDRSPEGRRDAEIFGAGCGLVPGYVLLPDTKNRLRTHDRLRIGLLSRRFSPDICIALDDGAELQVDHLRPRHAGAVRRLNHDGRFVKLRAA